jgi:uncharacterized protein
MPRVVHFEIHVDDPERAIQFYKAVLGWEFTKWNSPVDYWLVVTGPAEQPGINGGLIRRQRPQSGDKVIAFICTVDVPNVDDFAQRAVKAGGQVVVPKMPIPTIGWLVYCKDTEGNIFGMMQADTKAK